MRFEQVRGWLRTLLVRLALVVTGGIVLAISLSINMNAGRAILAGLLSPDSPSAMVNSIARLLITAIGLWMIYRGLR
jgi:ABC-type nickel/cobalt efflux system permease component RcnA